MRICYLRIGSGGGRTLAAACECPKFAAEQALRFFTLFCFLLVSAPGPLRAEDAPKQPGPAPEKLELRYQGWSGRVLYPELAEELGYLAPVKLNWIGNTISGPQDIQAAVTVTSTSAALSTALS
ncbi:hypothetical protein [Bradyrhizobium sp. Leo121]|uniref:hypothetical protein n=1 Tax=Bradyrhizobium sp. Leo121 TaxID=1571195 RepID=UPI0013EF114E|nr:hypothetical protein [Bradyrhizobium sp. Leo121]